MPSPRDPDLTVNLAGGYYFAQLSRLVRELQPLYALVEPTCFRIDLSRLTFMGPAALALTVATLSDLRNRNVVANGSVIVSPAAAGIATYLKRMDFYKVLFEDLGESPVPDVHHRKVKQGLRECEHFIEDAECRKVAKSLSDAVEETVTMDALAAKSLYLCLTELTENVYYHADTPLGGFAAAQSLKGTRELEIGIADLGVGIRASLAKNPDYTAEATDDLSAIKTAMRPTVTATPTRNSGYGLAFTQFLLELNEGRLMVRSGTGHVQVGERRIEKVEEYPLPGTLVALRLHTDRPFDFQKAYALLNKAINTVRKTEPRNDDPDAPHREDR
jgi:hypothetical protein